MPFTGFYSFMGILESKTNKPNELSTDEEFTIYYWSR
jgi:hypothetical protein